jgi:hypothetical protein
MSDEVTTVEKAMPKPTLIQEKKVKLLHQIMASQLQIIEFLPEEYQSVTSMVDFLKALIEKKLYVPAGKSELDIKKMAHDNYLTIAHTLSTRCRLKYKDMAPIVEAITFATQMAEVMRKEIELVEPPAEKKPEKPYTMDLTHVKPKDGNTDGQSTEQNVN